MQPKLRPRLRAEGEAHFHAIREGHIATHRAIPAALEQVTAGRMLPEMLFAVIIRLPAIVRAWAGMQHAGAVHALE